jgi:high-affinity iron transporter
MFETAVIVFREGLEAFLIVAIMLAYVIKAGHTQLKKPIYAGVITALIISATTGWHVAELAKNPLWEGTLALTAGVLVASFTVYVMRTASRIRSDIHGRLEGHAQKDGFAAIAGAFIFTVLMVAREGMETALMLGTIAAQQNPAELFGGAFFGVCLVGVIGFMWVSQSSKINLRLFLQVTGIFLVLFSIYLAIYGIHEIHEALEAAEHGAEPLAAAVPEEEGELGEIAKTVASYGLLVVPCGWLILSFIRDKFFGKKAPVAS